MSVEILLIERGAYFKPLSLSQFSVNNFVHINSQHQSHHRNNNKSYGNNHIVLDSIPHPLEAEPTSNNPSVKTEINTFKKSEFSVSLP